MQKNSDVFQIKQVGKKDAIKLSWKWITAIKKQKYTESQSPYHWCCKIIPQLYNTTIKRCKLLNTNIDAPQANYCGMKTWLSWVRDEIQMQEKAWEMQTLPCHCSCCESSPTLNSTTKLLGCSALKWMQWITNIVAWRCDEAELEMTFKCMRKHEKCRQTQHPCFCCCELSPSHDSTTKLFRHPLHYVPNIVKSRCS